MAKKSPSTFGSFEEALKSLKPNSEKRARPSPGVPKPAEPLADVLLGAMAQPKFDDAFDNDLFERISAHLQLDGSKRWHEKKIKDIKSIIHDSYSRDVSQGIQMVLPQHLFLTGEFADTIYDQILEIKKRGFASNSIWLLRRISDVGITFAKGEPPEELARIRRNYIEKAEHYAQRAGRSLEDISKEAGIDLSTIQ